MANIKVNELKTVSQAEIVDLKAEAEKGNPEAITAFQSLRGGLRADFSSGKGCWGVCPYP